MKNIASDFYDNNIIPIKSARRKNSNTPGLKISAILSVIIIFYFLSDFLNEYNTVAEYCAAKGYKYYCPKEVDYTTYVLKILLGFVPFLVRGTIIKTSLDQKLYRILRFIKRGVLSCLIFIKDALIKGFSKN